MEIKKLPRGILLIIFFTMFMSCSRQPESFILNSGSEVITYRALPFDISDVRLLEGPFLHATQLNERSLLNYEPDRLLAKFRIEAGLKPKAEHYEGWESMTIAGHSLGHYLSGCSLMFKTTGDSAFLKRVNYIVSELKECQMAEGNGYLGAVPGARKIFEEEVARGDIHTRGFDLNGLWSPVYTQHKILAGLLDASTLCRNADALEVARKFADWIGSYMSKLNHEQVQLLLNCEYGGINEALANLYALTKEEKYLRLSQKFYHEQILGPLSQSKDILAGKHANTQIPKLIGLARLYELTGDTTDKKTAEFFWDRVVHHHSYVTGGNGDQEYFGPSDSLKDRLSNNTTETCNVYNMLKLSRHLFEWNASAKVADFYERALLNHILSSQNPKDGRVIYNLSLEMGGYKVYQDPDSFTCCVGSGMETFSKYPSNIYYYNTDELWVAQFIASEVNWKEKQIVLKQVTQYPEEQSSSFSIACAHPVKFSLNIRYPYWAKSGIEIKINGKSQKIKKTPGSFICLNRTWKDGDSIELSMPFSLRTEPMPDDPDRVAVFYGPLVLAGDLGAIDDTMAYTPLFVPVFITNTSEFINHIKPIDGKKNEFSMFGIGTPRDINLKPFYKVNDRRYSVYWDLFTKRNWEAYQQEYKSELEKKKKIEQRTIDFFQPGEMQPERDHNFKGTDVWLEEHNGRKYRMANNSWMSCEMKTGGKKNISLVVEYWGGFPGSKTFDVFVEGIKIATENMANRNSGKFLEVYYIIPEKLLINKKKIEVKFVAWEGHRAGPVFGIRTLINK
jgi:uncharacterized protein